MQSTAWGERRYNKLHFIHCYTTMAQQNVLPETGCYEFVGFIHDESCLILTYAVYSLG